MKRLILIIVIWLVLACSSAWAVTITLQPDAAAGNDTFIKSTAATTNYGTIYWFASGEPNHEVNAYYAMLIKFDYSQIPASAILDYCAIQLTIETNNYNDNATVIKVYRSKRNVNETQATWNVYSTGNNWTSPGGFHADDCEQTEIGSANLSDSQVVGDIITIPLAVRTRAELETYSGYLYLNTTVKNNDLYTFCSSDHATPSLRPQLVIIYHLLGNAVM